MIPADVHAIIQINHACTYMGGDNLKLLVFFIPSGTGGIYFDKNKKSSIPQLCDVLVV